MKILSIDIGVKNLAFVVLDILDKKVTDIECDLIDITRGFMVKDVSNTELMDNLMEDLLYYYVPEDYDVILVEGQMAANPKCKNISMIVYTYFRMKNKSTELISSRLKLGAAGKTMSYNDKKKAAVKICKDLIGDELSTKLDALSRQHDAADAILQTYAWLGRACNAKKIT